jgi:hypothetical protein
MGVSIQSFPAERTNPGNVFLAVTVRDANFVPITAAWVDVFFAPLTQEANALLADGTCDGTVVLQSPAFDHFAPLPAGIPCSIETNDWQTNPNGNIGPRIQVIPNSTVWWAWTGAPGATFDIDTTAVSRAQTLVTTGNTGAVTNIRMTPGTNSTALVVNSGTVGALLPTPFQGFPGFQTLNGDGGFLYAHFGTVGYTAQLRDVLGQNVAAAGVNISITYNRFVNGLYDNQYTANATTDATGLATFSFTEQDPQPAAGFNNTVEYDIVAWTNSLAVVQALHPLWADEDIAFEDDPAFPAMLVADANIYSAGGTLLQPGATLYDQYGDPVAGVTVTGETNAAPLLGGGYPDTPALEIWDPLHPDDVTDANGHVSVNLNLPAINLDGWADIDWYVDDGGFGNWQNWIGPANPDYVAPCPACVNSNNPAFGVELTANQDAFFARVNPFVASAIAGADARDTAFGGIIDPRVVHVDRANDRFVGYVDLAPGNAIPGGFWVFEHGNEPAGAVFVDAPATLLTPAAWEAVLLPADALRINDTGVTRIWFQN